MTIPFRQMTLATVVVLTTMAPNALAEEPPIITVSGAIEMSNRGPSSADDATMLGAYDISFEKGFAVNRSALAGLDQLTYVGSIPGQTAPVTFRGPLIADILALAVASGETITVTALDGYSVEMDMKYLETHQPILAIEAGGASLAIGDLGPAVTVFPPTDDPKLAEEFAARQIWAAFHIGVR